MGACHRDESLAPVTNSLIEKASNTHGQIQRAPLKRESQPGFHDGAPARRAALDVDAGDGSGRAPGGRFRWMCHLTSYSGVNDTSIILMRENLADARILTARVESG